MCWEVWFLTCIGRRGKQSSWLWWVDEIKIDKKKLSFFKRMCVVCSGITMLITLFNKKRKQEEKKHTNANFSSIQLMLSWRTGNKKEHLVPVENKMVIIFTLLCVCLFHSFRTSLILSDNKKKEKKMWRKKKSVLTISEILKKWVREG